MSLQDLLAQANAAAETSADMNEAVQGGGGARLLHEGYAFGRLVEYVELGNHPQEFGGKAKDPALEVQVAFALWGTGYQNEDGSPYIIRPFRFAISRNEKAKAYLLFKSLNWKGTAKTFAQLLGQAFLVKIVNSAKSKTDATIVSRIDFKGFLPPIDPVSKAPYNIPEADASLYKLFLWERPTKLAWDSMYVEGQYDDGKSKNYLQEYMMGALDYAGSPIDQLLSGPGLALPTAPAVAPQVPLAPVAPAVAAVPVSPTPPVMPVSPAAPSAIPAGSPTTSPSSPVMPPAMPLPHVLPTLPQ